MHFLAFSEVSEKLMQLLQKVIQNPKAKVLQALSLPLAIPFFFFSLHVFSLDLSPCPVCPAKHAERDLHEDSFVGTCCNGKKVERSVKILPCLGV